MSKTIDEVKEEISNIIFWPEPEDLNKAYDHMNTQPKESYDNVINNIADNVIKNSDQIKQTILFAIENGIDID